MKLSYALAVLLLATGTGCKKDTPVNAPGYPPPTTPAAGTKWVVTTVAGDGTDDLADGPLSLAKFQVPDDIAIAPDGTLYVTDLHNRVIRKITAGQVSTIAGGDKGIFNANGRSAKFLAPYGITMDANGNLYISDVEDPRIRKITSAGDVSTYAGSEEDGFADGDADTAEFGYESRIASDAAGNVYVADAQNNRIRKIGASGKVSTIAGSGVEGFRDGEGKIAQFHFPRGVAVDKQGNVYVADGGNYRIRKITPAGQVTTVPSPNFNYPSDIVVDSIGNLYVLDIHRIREISVTGVVSTIAGSTEGFADGNGSAAKFSNPDGICIDAKGNIYVADSDNHRIRKISVQ